MKKFMFFIKSVVFVFVILTYSNLLNCAEDKLSRLATDNPLNDVGRLFVLQYKNAAPHVVLGVNENAGTEEIDQAFADLSRRWSLANWPENEDLILQVNHIIKSAYDKMMFKRHQISMNSILNKALNKGVLDNLKRLLEQYNILDKEIAEILFNLEKSKHKSERYYQDLSRLSGIINERIVNLPQNIQEIIWQQLSDLKLVVYKDVTEKILQTNKPYAFNKIGSFKVDHKIKKMAWSSKGVLAYQLSYGVIKFWDLNTHTSKDFPIEDISRRDDYLNITNFKWSPDGNLLAVQVKSHEKNEIQIWDYENKILFRNIEMPRDINIKDFSWSPDNTKLAIVLVKTIRREGEDGNTYVSLIYYLAVFDIGSNKMLFENELKTQEGRDYERGNIEMIWIKDHSLAVLFDTSKVLNIYDINLEQASAILKEQIPLVSSVAQIAANEKQLILRDYGISILDTDNFHLIHQANYNFNANELKSSTQENIIAISSLNKDNTNRVRILDLKNQNILKTFLAGAGGYDPYWSPCAWSQDPNNLYFAFVNFTRIGRSMLNREIEQYMEVEIWQGTKLK